jgi:GNAT superfamily N-acetyltransferase
MKIERKPPLANELASMYQDAGWIDNPDPNIMGKSVDSGSEWFVARDNDSNLLGISRLITDYARYAFIVDVIIKKEHRKQGIGTALMNTVISECRTLGIDSVNLWPSEGKVAFYEGLGFYALPASQPHMKLRNIV